MGAPARAKLSVFRVAFFGAYDPSYPRVLVFREALASAGVEVIEALVAERRAWRRYPALTAAFLSRARSADAILVPAFRHKDMPLARWLAGPRPLVFDPLVSRHDTLVHDWRLHAAGSGQARWNRWIDRWSLTAADLVLCDTWEHGRLYQSLGVREDRLRRVVVGAERAFFEIGPAPVTAGPVRIVYVGGFLPLHGVPVILEAAARLERDAPSLPDYTIELVGEGIESAAARALAAKLELRRVAFLGKSAYADAPARFASAAVVLGAFGASEKAGRVIPHKVFQGLAAGRAVVTGDGPGIREAFEPGVHLLLVPRSDPAALAEALRALLQDPERRLRLAACGRARARELGSPERIGAELVQAIEGLLAARR